MGGNDSKFEAINKIDTNQWRPLATENGAEIVKSNRGYGQGQIRMIALDPKKTFDEEMKIYNYRKNQNNALVSCYGVEALKAKSTTMCGNEQNLKVLTERIPYRWPTLPKLSQPQILYSLGQCLRGFQDLHTKAGPFQVTPNMIGVNNENSVKVWLNENYAQNHPTLEKPFLQTTSSDIYSSSISSEASMVRSVIDIVESKCQNGQYPPDFDEKIKRASLSFDDALEGLYLYSKESRINPTEQILQNLNPNVEEKKLQPEPQQIYMNTIPVSNQVESRHIYKMQSVPDSGYKQNQLFSKNPGEKVLNSKPIQSYGGVEPTSPTNRFTYESSHLPVDFRNTMNSPKGSRVTFNYGASHYSKQF